MSSSTATEGPSRIGVALFGIGRAGQFHFDNLVTLPQFRLVCVVDAVVEVAQSVVRSRAWEVPIVDANDMDAVTKMVLENAEVEAVVVASPTFTHEQIVRASIKHGKKLFVEKPLSMTTEGTKECFELAEAAGLPLMVAFQRRFDPSFAAARERAMSGALGPIEVIRSTSRDNPVPPVEYLKISGGMMHDCVIHDADMICWHLPDQRPVTVFAQGHAFREQVRSIGDVDTITVQIQFSKGTLAMIDVSRIAAYGYDQRLEVFGAKGMAEVGHRTPQAARFSDASGVHTSVAYHSFTDRYREAYRAELVHFAKVVRDGVAPLTTSAEVMLALSIVEAAEESMKTGKVVKMGEMEV